MYPDDHQTFVAIAALLIWPVVGLCIFRNCKPFSRALIWNLLAAQLLLPVAATLKFQMVPPIDKVTIANFCALLGCIIFSRRKSTTRSVGFGLVEILLLLNIFGPIVTSKMNPDDIMIGDRVLPGVGLYDAISAAEAALIALIPFMLGRRFLRTAEDGRTSSLLS